MRQAKHSLTGSRDPAALRIGEQFELSRREVLKALGGGLLLLVSPASALVQGRGRRGGGAQSPQVVSAWLHIGADGKATVLTGKVEVGQNARTSLTQAVSEELRLPTESIRVVMGDTDLVPFDMGTFGSRTTPMMVPQLRRAAAAAREALVDMAAEQLGVDRSSLKAENGRVFQAGSSVSESPAERPDSVSLTYGEIAKGIPLDRPIPAEIGLTGPEDWKVLGDSVRKVDGDEIVTGRHRYSADQTRPGMLHAKVLRPPSLGATLSSADTKDAEAMPGVRVVRDGGFVAVAAPTLRQAERALLSISAEWRETPQPSAKDLFPLLRGGELAGSSRSGATLKATYTAAYIAHAPLEPRAALAEWDGAKATVHTGTQRPFGVRGEVSEALGIPEDRVRVIVPDTGSGYGGKHSGDAAVEAARISKALGKPVRLVWTRQEEFTFAYFRPAGVVEVSATLSPEGSLASWEFENYNSGGSGIATPYRIPSPRTQSRQASSPLRQGSYRALAATFNHFARECFMDELAHASGAEPLAFRLKHLDNPRLRAVLEAAAERFGWGRSKPGAGRGFGIACGVEKGGYVATAAEVAVNAASKQINVLRAVTAFECGAVLNPDHLKNQVEGAVLQGIGGALFEEIEFEGGRVLTDRFSRYRVPRFADMPVHETLLLDRKDLPPAGGGETPIVAIAPAIGNAVFQAAGVRLRALPMRLS